MLHRIPDPTISYSKHKAHGGVPSFLVVFCLESLTKISKKQSNKSWRTGKSCLIISFEQKYTKAQSLSFLFFGCSMYVVADRIIPIIWTIHWSIYELKCSTLLLISLINHGSYVNLCGRFILHNRFERYKGSPKKNTN